MTVQVVAAVEQFAHLERARPGTQLRFLEVPLLGSPLLLQATATATSEIFLTLPREAAGGDGNGQASPQAAPPADVPRA